MSGPSRKRPKIGDVVKISTAAGCALAQYTHKHQDFGPLVRIFQAPSSPELDPAKIAQLPLQFSAFFPLGAACNRGIATIVGSAPVRAELQPFPTFRSSRSLDPKDQGRWWLWDGEREWHVGRLTPSQQEMPTQSIVNDTLLVERALAGWTNSDERW